MKTRLYVRIGLCTLLIAGLVSTGGGTALARCETVWLEVYDVRLDIARESYRFGDTVDVEATVTRKEFATPVAGARFAVIVWNTRKGLMFGFEETDSAGRATASLKLERGRLKPGPVRLRAMAYKLTQDPTTCVQVFEYGEKRVRKAFVVEP